MTGSGYVTVCHHVVLLFYHPCSLVKFFWMLTGRSNAPESLNFSNSTKLLERTGCNRVQAIKPHFFSHSFAGRCAKLGKGDIVGRCRQDDAVAGDLSDGSQRRRRAEGEVGSTSSCPTVTTCGPTAILGSPSGLA